MTNDEGQAVILKLLAQYLSTQQDKWLCSVSVSLS